jgi:hypothetical protein
MQLAPIRQFLARPKTKVPDSSGKRLAVSIVRNIIGNLIKKHLRPIGGLAPLIVHIRTAWAGRPQPVLNGLLVQFTLAFGAFHKAF